MSLPAGSQVSKDPQASAWPRGMDWTAYLAKISAVDTITTSTWAVTGLDSLLTTASGSIITGALKTQIRLSGGTLGRVYTVTNSITTSSGVVDDASFTVLIEQL